jgi:radical SAM superfamily enzyme YgiQ (UPF0313 family)
LTYLKKGRIKVEDNKRALRIAKKYGITGQAFIMIGSPYETLEDMEKTYEFVKENCRETFIAYQTVPFPGTEIWDYAIENKIVNKDFWEKEKKGFIYTNILLSKEVSKKEFEDMFHKLRAFHVKENKKLLFKKILLLRPRHIISILSPMFLKKAYALRKQFIERVFKK